MPRRYRGSRQTTTTLRQNTAILGQNTTILRQNTTILGQNTTILRQNTEEICGDTQREPTAIHRGNLRRYTEETCGKTPWKPAAEVNLHGGSEFTKSNDQRTSPLHFLSKVVDRNDSTDERAILESLFYKGYEYNEIINLLKTQHNIRMSGMRTLKRRLKFYNLSRNNVEFDPGCLRNTVVEILDGPGISQGYRSIWHTLQRKGA